MAENQDDNLPEFELSAASGTGDVPGELLADDHLITPDQEYRIASDEDEAEELGGMGTEEVAEPDDEQLAAAESVAAAAASTRPQRRVKPEVPAAAKKAVPTPRRGRAATVTVTRRTTPVQFVRESADELRKVVWPTADQLRQYFVVVLIFVLLVIAYVTVLDLLFGWGLLRIFG